MTGKLGGHAGPVMAILVQQKNNDTLVYTGSRDHYIKVSCAVFSILFLIVHVQKKWYTPTCVLFASMCYYRIEVKEIFAVMKELKQLQIKPRKNSEASTQFTHMIFHPFTPKLIIPILLSIQEQMYEWFSEN